MRHLFSSQLELLNFAFYFQDGGKMGAQKIKVLENKLTCFSDRERHAPCAIVPLKTEMSHRFLQWMRPGLFPIFTVIFGTK